MIFTEKNNITVGNEGNFMLAEEIGAGRKINCCNTTAKMIRQGQLGVTSIDKDGMITDVLNVAMDRRKATSVSSIITY